MEFPLNFWDVSLWISFTAIILLVVMEIMSPQYGKINITINKKKLKNVTYIMLILFIITGIARLLNIMLIVP